MVSRLKVNNKHFKKVLHIFKVNDKDTRMTSLTLFEMLGTLAIKGFNNFFAMKIMIHYLVVISKCVFRN